MMMVIGRFWIFCLIALSSSVVHPRETEKNSPQAGIRTYAQNYKDMVLAECIATAYRQDPSVARGAGSSASALRDWTSYDWEDHPYDNVLRMVERYLARDYRNPLAESEVRGIRFDFLKCLDLYHSKELEAETLRIVITPMRSYRQDNPGSATQK